MSNLQNIEETPKKKRNKSIVSQNLTQKKEYEKKRNSQRFIRRKTEKYESKRA